MFIQNYIYIFIHAYGQVRYTGWIWVPKAQTEPNPKSMRFSTSTPKCNLNANKPDPNLTFGWIRIWGLWFVSTPLAPRYEYRKPRPKLTQIPCKFQFPGPRPTLTQTSPTQIWAWGFRFGSTQLSPIVPVKEHKLYTLVEHCTIGYSFQFTRAALYQLQTVIWGKLEIWS